MKKKISTRKELELKSSRVCAIFVICLIVVLFIRQKEFSWFIKFCVCFIIIFFYYSCAQPTVKR